MLPEAVWSVSIVFVSMMLCEESLWSNAEWKTFFKEKIHSTHENIFQLIRNDVFKAGA